MRIYLTLKIPLCNKGVMSANKQILNTLPTSVFKPTTLTCALFTLKINIKSPN
jgi:hypothetical protein